MSYLFAVPLHYKLPASTVPDSASPLTEPIDLLFDLGMAATYHFNRGGTIGVGYLGVVCTSV